MTFAGRLAPARLREALEAASTPAFKLTFALLLIMAALGATYIGSGGNFPEIELRDVLARGMAISAVLLLCALAISLRSRTAANGALALVTLASIFSAYIVHTELFHPANRVWLVASCAAAGVALFAAFRLIDETRRGGPTLTAVASLPLVILVWSRVWPMVVPGLGASGGLLYWGNPLMWFGLLGISVGLAFILFVLLRVMGAPSCGGFALLAITAFLACSLLWLNSNYGEFGDGYYTNGWGGHPRMQSVAFETTPNVYFVGFDSIVPEAILQKYMGIEATAFHRIFDEEMRRLRNLFAVGVPTSSFYRALMALDLNILMDHREATGSTPNYFSGQDLSPLVWVLRENSYETTAIFNDTFFGYRRGQGIDNYIINRQGTVCSLLDDAVVPWALWGYCWSRTGESGLTKGDFLVQELVGVDQDTPQFVNAHLYLPGHTPKVFDYDHRDDREAYLKRYEVNFNAAAEYLEQILDHIKANDPTAILFVHGDHGAWLSRGMDIEDDPTFFLQDRFGILGGVYPPDRCAAEFDEAESKGYMTSLDVVHAILECLSGGQSPLREPRNDRFWGSGVPEDHDYRYEDFLYE